MCFSSPPFVLSHLFFSLPSQSSSNRRTSRHLFLFRWSLRDRKWLLEKRDDALTNRNPTTMDGLTPIDTRMSLVTL